MKLLRDNEWITDAPEMTQVCEAAGVQTDTWDFPTCKYQHGDADFEQNILNAIAQPLAQLKAQRGYVSEDIVALFPDTLNLAEKLAPFQKEHHHTDDEVRVILGGEGIFGIVPEDQPPFEIHMQAGDMIVIPANARHWFTLTEQNHVVALRVFKENPVWAAIYEPLACVN